MPELRQEQAMGAPAGKTVRLEIAGAHDDVHARSVRGDEPGDVGGAVRKVGVHRDELVVAPIVGVRDAFRMRAADAELALAVDHRDPRMPPRESVQRRAGAVGRAVVDEQDVRRERQRDELRAQPLDVAVLVVGRREDQAARRHRRVYAETTSMDGSGNRSRPPAARYAASRSTMPARKCHGSTRK